MTAAAQELTPPVIDVAATHFTFAPDHLTLRRGDAVTLRFSADERGLRVSQRDLRIHMALTPEHTSEVTIVPSKSGRFVAVSAGRDDARMVIDVVE